MELKKYNHKALMPIIGFNNLGNNCFFNALIQALLSCSAFIEEIQNINSSNKVVVSFNAFFNSFKKGENNQITQFQSNISLVILQNMMRELRRKDAMGFQFQQQCSREAYHFILESLDKLKPIQNLFLHKYISKIFCQNCDNWVSEVKNYSNIFEISPYYDKTTPIEEALKYQINTIDDDYVCNNCHTRGNKIQKNTLVLAPEILVIMIRKYTPQGKININTQIDDEIKLKGKNGQYLYYQSVAKIEHSGSLKSGHYWCKVRRNGAWYNANDNHISATEPDNTVHTYMMFYHFMRTG